MTGAIIDEREVRDKGVSGVDLREGQSILTCSASENALPLRDIAIANLCIFRTI